jgi:hypothetical protein
MGDAVARTSRPRPRLPRRSVVVSDKLWGRVRERASDIGISTSEFVRTALLERLAREGDGQAHTPGRRDVRQLNETVQDRLEAALELVDTLLRDLRGEGPKEPHNGER